MSSNIPRVAPTQLAELRRDFEASVQREKEFPLRLNQHQNANDMLTTEATETYKELLTIMKSNINSNPFTSVEEKNQSAEIIALLEEQFTTMFQLFRDNAVLFSTEFADYKHIIYTHFEALMKYERAKLHIGVDTWRMHWIQRQANNTIQLQAAAQTVRDESEKNLQLQKSLSSLTLRIGLVNGEKKVSDAKLSQARKQIDYLENTVKQLEISQKTVVDEFEMRLTSSNSKRHEADTRLEKERERAATALQKCSFVGKRLELEAEKVKQLTATNDQLQVSNATSSVNQANLSEDLNKLLIKYNDAVKKVEEKEKCLVTAEFIIIELQRKEKEFQRVQAVHARELKSVEDQFKEYRKSFEVSLKGYRAEWKKSNL
jgi:hypothetical protein